MDEKEVRITADNLTYSAYQSTMDLLIENNSDQDLSVISGSIGYSCNAVNGYTVSSMYVNENVSAGMKVNTSISISNEELEALGITDIAELEIGFQVKTSDYQDYLTTDPVKIKSSGGIRLVSAGLVSSGDIKATLLELENTGAMKYGISKSSLEDNKIGTGDITMVSFQLNISSGSFYNYIDQPKLTISYN